MNVSTRNKDRVIRVWVNSVLNFLVEEYDTQILQKAVDKFYRDFKNKHITDDDIERAKRKLRVGDNNRYEKTNIIDSVEMTPEVAKILSDRGLSAQIIFDQYIKIYLKKETVEDMLPDVIELE